MYKFFLQFLSIMCNNGNDFDNLLINGSIVFPPSNTFWFGRGLYLTKLIIFLKYLNIISLYNQICVTSWLNNAEFETKMKVQFLRKKGQRVLNCDLTTQTEISFMSGPNSRSICEYSIVSKTIISVIFSYLCYVFCLIIFEFIFSSIGPTLFGFNY
jgi:hypothetical protein